MKIPNNDTHYKRYKKGLYNSEIQFYKNLLEKYEDVTIIDAGSNIGYFPIELRGFYKKIHCFEPVKEIFECLQENCLDIEGVVLNQAGLYDENITKEIMVSTAHSQGSSIDPRIHKLFPNIFTDKREEIRLTKLSDYIVANDIGNIALIKLDIEGCEINIIKDLFTIPDKFSNIVFECYFPEDIKKIKEIIKTHPEFEFKSNLEGMNKRMYQITKNTSKNNERNTKTH